MEKIDWILVIIVILALTTIYLSVYGYPHKDVIREEIKNGKHNKKPIKQNNWLPKLNFWFIIQGMGLEAKKASSWQGDDEFHDEHEINNDIENRKNEAKAKQGQM